ncbi:type I glyceraldehyde-3-phosphate dehydrogenase [Candidatus Dependentiae bacterium]|nr:type I glyceraldehyde-3-phosphate dehydrogenase [Candidatus Dependentiae bacterium]
MNIAINGFGRIGKNFLRVILNDQNAKKKLNVVAINVGPNTDIKAVAHGFKYDSLLGTFSGKVEQDDKFLFIDNFKIRLFAVADPKDIVWSKLNIEWVVDATGHFTKREMAEKHIDAGAKRVLITAPANDEDIAIVPGVNLNLYKKNKHKIVSLCSCTSNAAMVMLKIIDDNFEIEKAAMSTVHAYTNTQPLLDVDPKMKNLRKSRAGAINIIPTTTGAMEVVDKVIPSLKGKVTGCALRVPIDKVSIIDLGVITKKKMTKESIHKAFITASKKDLKGIVDVNFVPLVSCDFKNNDHSVIIEADLTDVLGDHFAKVFGWYDNEWGYSQRLKDFLLAVI